MNWALPAILVLLLAFSAWVAWSDFRERQVSILALSCFTLVVATDAVYAGSFSQLFTNFLANLVFLLLQFLILTVYISLKKNKLTSVINSHIGSADIWIMIALALPFFWANFILFMTAALILSLLLHVASIVFRKNSDTRIPLAAYLVVNYATVRCLFYFLSWSPADESLIYSFFIP